MVFTKLFWCLLEGKVLTLGGFIFIVNKKSSKKWKANLLIHFSWV